MPLSPPKLSRDSRSYHYNKSTPHRVSTEIESKTPRDLPGKGEKSITTQNFYPYEESLNSDNVSLSKSGSKVTLLEEDIGDKNEKGSSSNSSSDSSSNESVRSSKSSDTDLENLDNLDDQIQDLTPAEEQEIEVLEELRSPDTFPVINDSDSDNDIIIMSESKSISESKEIEMFLKEHRFAVHETYILTENTGDMIYLVKLCSFYGTCFFIKFDEKIIVGDEKIFLNETKDDFDLVMFSPEYTQFLRDAEAITIFDESIVYKGKVYGNGNEMLRTHNPVSHPVVSESVLESPFDPFKLAVTVHDMWIDIDALYKKLLVSSYNKMMDSLEDFIEDIENKRQILDEIDEINENESEQHDKSFIVKLQKEEFPAESESHRMKFLRKSASKYSQAQFILWKRVHENLMLAKKEFEQSITSIFIEMKKDFPEEDIELDDSIDVSRSYPGKIFLKE